MTPAILTVRDAADADHGQQCPASWGPSRTGGTPRTTRNPRTGRTRGRGAVLAHDALVRALGQVRVGHPRGDGEAGDVAVAVDVGRTDLGRQLRGDHRGVGRVPVVDLGVVGVIELGLFHVGEDGDRPAGVVGEQRGALGLGEGIVGVQRAGREAVVGAEVVVHRQAHLLQVVVALDAAGRLAGRLDGGQEQRDQHGDDRDDDEQLDQGEPRSPRRLDGLSSHGASPDLGPMEEARMASHSPGAGHDRPTIRPRPALA